MTITKSKDNVYICYGMIDGNIYIGGGMTHYDALRSALEKYHYHQKELLTH